MKLHSAIREIVQSQGQDAILDIRFVNMLIDLNAFNDVPATKYIMRAIINDGYMQKFLQLGEWSSPAMNLSQKYASITGFDIDAIDLIFQSIAYGLAWVQSVDVNSSNHSQQASQGDNQNPPQGKPNKSKKQTKSSSKPQTKPQTKSQPQNSPNRPQIVTNNQQLSSLVEIDYNSFSKFGVDLLKIEFNVDNYSLLLETAYFVAKVPSNAVNFNRYRLDIVCAFYEKDSAISNDNIFIKEERDGLSEGLRKYRIYCILGISKLSKIKIRLDKKIE